MKESLAKNHLMEQIQESFQIKKNFFDKEAMAIVGVAKEMAQVISSGRKILICGNGGSASDAQHFAGELVGRFLSERRALPALSLATDTSVLTAVGNDYGYKEVFARQVQGLGTAGDMLFALSTSGNSPNILEAVKVAKEQKLSVVALTGKDGGVLGGLADTNLNVSLGKSSPRIQEVHIMIIHSLVDLMDTFFLENNNENT